MFGGFLLPIQCFCAHCVPRWKLLSSGIIFSDGVCGRHFQSVYRHCEFNRLYPVHLGFLLGQSG